MAGPSASTINFGNLIAPDVASQQLQLQRQQQLVDLLRQQSITPTPTETAGGMAVRQSPLGGVSKMLSAYLAGQRQKDIDEKSLGLNREMAQRYAQILGGGLPGSASGDASSAPSAPIDSNALAALSQGAAAGSVGPTVANAQRMDSMPPAPPADTGPQASSAPQVTSAPQQGPAPQAQAPLQSAPPGSTNFNLANLLRGGVVSQLAGDAAGAAYWKQYEPTDATKMATAAGSDPVAANAAALRHATFLTPTRMQPGGGVADFNHLDAAGQPTITTMPASPAPGTINMPTPGTPSGFTNVQVNGALPNIGAAAGAESGGKAAGKAPFETPIPLPMSDGRTLSLSRTEYAAYQQNGQLPARYSGVQPNAGPAPTSAPSAPGPSAQPADADRSAIYASEIAKTQDMIANPRNYMSPNLLAQDPTGAQFVARAKNDLAGLQNEAAKLRPNPAGPTAPSTGAVPVVGMTPPLGTQTGQEAAQTELSKKWTDLNAANSQAQTTSSYLENIKQLAGQAATGPFTNKLQFANSLLSLVGSQKATDATTANALLDKYSNQIVARLGGSGALGTDSARTLLQSAYPNAHMTVDAINEAADNLKGANDMVKAKTSFLQQQAARRDPQAYSQREVLFDQNADPRIWQLKNMDAETGRKYLGSLPPAVQTDLRRRAAALHQAGAF